jgi:hypothetical protein
MYLNLFVEMLKLPSYDGDDQNHRAVEYRVSLGLGSDQFICGLASQFVVIFIQV